MHFVDAKGILTGSGGRYGMNIYRGCSHGCIYCDSRSRCYQFTHAFEDIEVKQNAPELLEKALKSKKRRCMIGTGAMSDPYMHCEEELRLTRKCLEIIRQYGFGAAIQTKSDRILRDIDLLDAINRTAKCVVQMTLTTYDDDLCRLNIRMRELLGFAPNLLRHVVMKAVKLDGVSDSFQQNLGSKRFPDEIIPRTAARCTEFLRDKMKLPE